MYNDYKFTYANISKTAFNNEIVKRGSYYANVVMWTTFFTLPVFVLLDYLFCKELWTDFLLLRLVGAFAAFILYSIAKNNKWDYLKTIVWFLGINVITNAIITSLVYSDVGSPLSYFLILSIIMLIINTTIFWPPINSIYLCILSYITILVIYSLKSDINKYINLAEQGGIVYFLISAFSCLLAYTRFQILCRDAERTVMVNDANEKLINKTEQIKDIQFKTEETNRKLKSVSETSIDNMTVLMDDYKNFSENVKSQLDEIKTNSYNLMPSQLEALNKISVDNEKLNYLAQKLGGTAAAVTTANNEVSANQDVEISSIQFNKEYLDINPEVEKAVLEIAEGAMLKSMNLQLNISPAHNNIFQDKLFIEQVLNKLMSNVIKVSNAGSIITVRAEQQNNNAVVETISHGAIIGNEKLEEMMNRLKYSSITDETTLNDLGLIATKKLVESMNGKFTFNSEHETGNYFRIEFPSA